MKKPTWNELQEMFDNEEFSEMIENFVDSPSEDNFLMIARAVIETYIETQK